MICIAWGEPEAFQVEGLDDADATATADSVLWGREFDLLPTGTMANAHLMLHGLLAVRARKISGLQIEITDDRVLMVGTRGTNTDDLIEHQEVLLDLFSALPISQQKP